MGGCGIIYRVISLLNLIANGIATRVGCMGVCGVSVWGIIYHIRALLNLITNSITTCVGMYGVCGMWVGWVCGGSFTVSYLYLT